MGAQDSGSPRRAVRQHRRCVRAGRRHEDCGGAWGPRSPGRWVGALQAPGALSDDKELPRVLKGDTGVTEGLEGEEEDPRVWGVVSQGCLQATLRSHGCRGGNTRGTG